MHGDNAEALRYLKEAYDRGCWNADVVELAIGFVGPRGNAECERGH